MREQTGSPAVNYTDCCETALDRSRQTGKSLVQIRLDVINMLNSHCNLDQVFPYAQTLAHLGRQIPVRGNLRVEQQGMNIPEGRTRDDHPKVVHKLQNRALIRASDFETEDCTKQTGRKRSANNLGIRMVGVRTVIHAFNPAVVAQPAG